MPFRSKLKKLSEIIKYSVDQPGLSLMLLSNLPNMARGFNYSQHWQSSHVTEHIARFSPEYETTDASSNPLNVFFDAHKTGRGIWKWIHYFDIYHRHFSKFVERNVHILEIGVYSGGSLEMWRHYFGPNCRVYGVDIEEACKCYENDYTEIFIGDQANRNFWKTFKERVPVIDILIDDGGHQPEQQIVTLEEMLPHLRPGGVYLCEDIIIEHNGFAAFMQGVVNSFNAHRGSDAAAGISTTEFQSWIRSVHFYPFVTVLEKGDSPVQQFISPKHGTEWQPFL
jgi:hypothetical protein